MVKFFSIWTTDDGWFFIGNKFLDFLFGMKYLLGIILVPSQQLGLLMASLYWESILGVEVFLFNCNLEQLAILVDLLVENALLFV
jgi:hypothetical protein